MKHTAATALSESIDGRYGGVGLVIAGIPQPVQPPPPPPTTKTTSILSPATSTTPTLFQTPILDLVNPTDTNKLLPLDAQKDNELLKESQEVVDDSNN